MIHHGAMLLGLGLAALTAGLSSNTASGSASGSTITTASVTAIPAGGSGLVTHSWSRVSGSASITANTPAAATTNFTGSGIGIGANATATFKNTITDTITGEVVDTANVTIYVERSNPPLSVSVSGSGVKTQTSSTTITVTSDGVTLSPSGGVPPYSYSHAHLTANDFSINNPSGATSSHSRALGPGGGVSGTVRGTVTDAIGQTAVADYGVVLINNGSPPPSLSASASPGSVDGYSDGIVVVTPSVTATPSGGSGSYVSRSWARIGGVGDPTSPSSDTTAFTANVAFGETVTGTFRYSVTDSLGNTASVVVSASFTNWGTPPGGFG